MLTMADKGGRGGLDPPIFADIICEQPLSPVQYSTCTAQHSYYPVRSSDNNSVFKPNMGTSTIHEYQNTTNQILLPPNPKGSQDQLMGQFIVLASVNHFKAPHVRAVFPACLLIRAFINPALFVLSSPGCGAVQHDAIYLDQTMAAPLSPQKLNIRTSL